ncbi:TonB-dependent receptor [Dyella acidiphila]|uniref:TonB-dependent receptor n=1 Tax=Dyella acidiphila TaxID=2775866 RepID=A0ABR9G883_9GAMM|nr:TonB-dependent receptor [Dyella acidiphila]MBE1160263.1 TonB-dependent receptor [Dyella acidiphila]
MTRNKLALSLAGLLLAPIAGTAFAQSAPAQDQSQPTASQSNPQQLQTITVTGSALPRVDTETPSPVTVLTAQQIARSGYTTISDVVRSISADNSGSIPNAFTAGFAAGASGVALRGLTVNSTVVLIDGHRAASYPVSDDGERSFVDLNTIPISAVERIEVLKDGASSLYGADAIAGVVNIILKPGYQGVEGTADIGNSQHGGGFTKKATFLAGFGDLNKDRYNVYFSAQYEMDNPIYNRERDYPYNSKDLTALGGPNGNFGNPATFNGSTVGATAPATLGVGANPLTGATQVKNSLYSPLGSCTNGTVLTSTAGVGSYCAENQVAQYGEIQPQTEQGGLYARGTFKINDTTKAYLSVSYMESKLWAQLTPQQIQTSTPNNTNNIALPPVLTTGPNAGKLNPNDPYAAAGEYALLNYQFGDIPQNNTYDNHNARVVADVSGIAGEWNYDAAVVLNHDWLNTTQTGFINYPALVNAITSGSYNFINPSANSAAELAQLSPNLSKQSTSDLDSLDLNASRSLFDLPGGSAGLAVGSQFRYEAQNDPALNPDDLFQSLGIAQTKGHRNVSGAYAELDLPLLESLEVDASGRYDHYSDVGNNFSPKIGFKWKPLDWVAIRGTYSKGFRAPSFAENGSSSSEGFVTLNPAQYTNFVNAHNGNAYSTVPYSLAEYTVANPNIRPEKASNFTFGVVLQPTSWLNASVDYYDIKKSNVITGPNFGQAISNYFATGATGVPGVTVIPDIADPTAPNAQARPAEFIGQYINANSLKTDGVDIDLQGHWDFGNGIHYVSELSGTEVFNWRMVLPDGTVESFAGTQGPYNLSSGAGTPRLKGSWSNTVQYGPATVTATIYYTGGYSEIAEDVGVGPDSCLSFNAAGTQFLPSNCRISSFTDVDLTGSYAINSHISVTASIMNAMDRKAPFDPANYAAVNYNPTYSYAGVVGRFYNLGVKVKF